MRDARHPRARSRSRTGIALALACLAVLPLLAGCAPGTDPEATKESLRQVTEEPAESGAAEEYDARLHPDPVVEPLECADYLVITARGTGEPSRGQLLSPVARAIEDARPDQVVVLDLDYPADTDVQEGGTAGARVLVDTLNVQAAACPLQRFVLLGYSQGALVIGDALAEAEVRVVGATVGDVEEATQQRILAIVLYGDPRFMGLEAYNAGSYSPALNGLLPRPEGALAAYADRIRDYCVAGDFVCQSSLDLDEQPHVAYYENGMQADGAAFVISRLDPIDEPATSETDQAAEGRGSASPDADSAAAADVDADGAGR